MDVIDIILRRKDRPGSRGYQYEVWRGDELLCASRDPEYAACRRLLEMGCRGTVRFWRAGRAEFDSAMDIERGARAAASEGNRASIRVAKYSEHWLAKEDGEEPEEAIAA